MQPKPLGGPEFAAEPGPAAFNDFDHRQGAVALAHLDAELGLNAPLRHHWLRTSDLTGAVNRSRRVHRPGHKEVATTVIELALNPIELLLFVKQRLR